MGQEDLYLYSMYVSLNSFSLCVVCFLVAVTSTWQVATYGKKYLFQITVRGDTVHHGEEGTHGGKQLHGGGSFLTSQRMMNAGAQLGVSGASSQTH